MKKRDYSYSKPSKHSKIKKIGAVISMALLSTAFIAGCTGNDASSSVEANQEVTTVTIGYLPITHSLAVLKEKELLEESNSNIQINLQKFSSWPDLMDALNAGKIDAASVLIELAMNAKSNGVDISAAALGHRDGNVVVVANDIDSVDDLKGKTFAIPSIQSSHNILLNELLENNGLRTDDINIVQLSPTEMPSSLASGSISGYCVAEPYGAVSVDKNFGKVLYTSDELWEDSLCCAFVLNNGFVDSNKDVANKLVKIYYEAASQLESGDTEEIASEYLEQSSSVLKQSLEWINFSDLTITEDEYNELCSKLISYKINDNPPSYDDFVYKADE